MAPDLVGRALGRYRIVEKIGEGGMGVVFRAIDDRLARTVALKVLGADVANDPERRARFLREARIAASITHPNLAAVYDVGETDDGYVYIAMELVAGVSLRARIAEGPMALATAVSIASDVARVLVKAHEAGIVHRDLKPDNLMVTDDAAIKVLDFGLAKPLPDVAIAGDVVTTRAGRVLGTPGYMAPEQAAGIAADERADIFALGVVLYEMTTGQRPFVGGSALDVLIATSRDEPAPPSKIRASVPRALDRVILRCLEKNADARYASARELLDAIAVVGSLDGASSGDDVSPDAGGAGIPTQQSLVRNAPSATRPRRLAVGALAAGAIAICALVVAVRLAAPRTGATASPVDDVAAPRATAITDLPFPASTNARAIAEYVAGVQALRDDDWGVAESHFEQVVALEPMLALGQLRLAMVGEGTLDESIRREHYARAVTLRGQLGARDEGMMQALEPVLQRLHEDRVESVQRLTALGARYPLDAEIQVWLAILQSSSAAGLASAERATALDPRDGQAWQSRGDALASLGRGDEARVAYERCGATSPGSSECFLGLIWLDTAEGRCADAERDARRAVDRDPHLGGNLACAMYGAGRPVPSVREVVDQSGATSASVGNQWRKLLDHMRIAIISGDFVGGRALAERYQAQADADPRTPFRDHLLPAIALVGIAREVGDEAQAFRVASSFVSRSDAWSKSAQGDAGMDASLGLARAAVRKGGLSVDEFEARRGAWIAAERQSLAHAGLIWTYAYAATAATPEEATAAITLLPQFAPLTSFVYYVGIPDAEVGAAYLRAGDVAASLPYLKRAAANCAAFRHPFVHTRALLDLGLALEKTGDAAGACDAYGRVIARWGDAKPRSLSAEHARARRKVLVCAT